MKIRKIKKLDLPRCIEILEKAYGRPPYNEVFKDLNANLYIEGKYKYCKDNSFVAVNKDQVVAFVFIKISAWSEGLHACTSSTSGSTASSPVPRNGSAAS